MQPQPPMLVHRSKLDTTTRKATRAALPKGTLEADAAEEAAQATRDLQAFEARLASGGAGGAGADFGLEWSKQAPEFHRLLTAERRNGGAVARESSLSSWQALAAKLEHLDLSRQRVAVLDPCTEGLEALRELNISHNTIASLQHLPRNLHCVHAYNNRIDSLSPRLSLGRLLHLGLGHNELVTLEDIPTACPSLISLDVSFNAIAEIPSAFSSLSQMPCLQHAVLCGNPLALCHGYRQSALEAAPGLATLDGLEVSRSERRAHAKRAAKHDESVQAAADAAARAAVGPLAYDSGRLLEGWTPPTPVGSAASSRGSSPRQRKSSSGKGKSSSKGGSKAGGKATKETPVHTPLAWEEVAGMPELAAAAAAARAAVLAHAADLAEEVAGGILLRSLVHGVSGLPTAAQVPGVDDVESAPSSKSSTPRKKGGKSPKAGAGRKGGRQTPEPAAPARPLAQFGLSLHLPDGQSVHTAGSPVGRDGVLDWAPVQVLLATCPATVAVRDGLLLDGISVELWEETVEGIRQPGADGASDAPAAQECRGERRCLATGRIPTELLLTTPTCDDRVTIGLQAALWSMDSGAGAVCMDLQALPREAEAAVMRVAEAQVGRDMREEAEAAAAAAASEASKLASKSPKGKGKGKGGSRRSPSPAEPQMDDEARALREAQQRERAAALARSMETELIRQAAVFAGINIELVLAGPAPSTLPAPDRCPALLARSAALDGAAEEGSSSSTPRKKGGRMKK